MRRREFLIGIGTVVIGAPWAASLGCGGGTSSTAPTPDGFTFESSFVDAHSHTVRVLSADLENPPAAGVVYATSVVGHAHTVALTRAELLAIQGGQAVAATTSVVLAHQHVFVISKP